MKKFYIIICFWGQLLAAQSPAPLGVLWHWDDDTLPIASPGNLNLQYSSVFGMAVNGHEFAILGGAHHILVFDVTIPIQTQLIGKFPCTATTVWREFKSYKNRLYAVSDNTSEGLQIFDFSNAPADIHRSYWSSEFFEKSHSITLDTVSGRIYLNGSNAAKNGLLILDISQNPDKPTFLANVSLPGGYIHDSYVRHDTVYASSGYNGLYVYDCKTDPTHPTNLASISTGGYNHNSWPTLDGKYLYYTEEIPHGRPMQVVDLQQLTTSGTIEIKNNFLNAMTPDTNVQATPHNVFIRDHWLFDSQYEDGVLVYDLAPDPLHPRFAFWYDTHPENTQYNGYFGCWGNYPWLPSGTLLASDMQNGLFVLGVPTLTATHETAKKLVKISTFPSPAHEAIWINIEDEQPIINWRFQMFNTNGNMVLAGQQSNTIDISMLPSGMYFLKVQTEGGKHGIEKVVKM